MEHSISLSHLKAFNMPGKKRPAVDDGDSSEDEINVDQVIKTKAELDKVLMPVYFLGHWH